MKKILSLIMIVSIMATSSIFYVSASEIDASTQSLLPVDDNAFSTKMPKSTFADLLVSTDYEMLEQVNDENYYDTIYVTKYMDNNDDELYYYRVPVVEDDEELISHAVEGSIDVSLINSNFSISNDTSVLSLTPAPCRIIGTDDRTRITDTKKSPYSAILYMEIVFPDDTSTTYVGSGWMISPTNAVTAGHNVYSEDHGGYADKIIVYAGRNGTFAPFGSQKVYGITTANEYTKYGDENYDYAIITLSSEVGTQTGYWGYQVADYLGKSEVTITGYPGRSPDDVNPTLWTHTERVVSETDHQIYYLVDTTPGQSGSPIYWGNNIAVGIHTRGWITTGDSGNHGPKITEEMFKWFQGYDW